MAGNSTSAAKRKQRGPGKPFQKGQSGNPSGLSRDRREFIALCQSHTAKSVDMLVNEIDQLGEHRIQAAVKLLEWAWGKPAAAPEDREAISNSGPGLAVLSTAEIVKAVKALNEPRDEE